MSPATSSLIPPCRTCAAWLPLADEPERGVCHRHAPTAHVLPDTDDDGAEGVATFTAWPVTDADKGCFDHLSETQALRII